MTNEPEHRGADRPRLVLGALRGSSGKTFVSLGLLAAWRAQGRIVAPFKKGPDYIDAAWHARAAGRPCRNLDSYLMPPEAILRSVGEAGGGADLSLVEGNHGLFDGVGPDETASTAALAKLLEAPVVLVVDCARVTRTIAAMVLGCQKMDPALRLAGVILNRVGTPRQETAIRSAVGEVCGIPVLGSIPRMPDLRLPERHLGLLTPAEHPEVARPIVAAREAVEAHVDLPALELLARQAPPLGWSVESDPEPTASGLPGVRIGIVRDNAFTFYYPENLEALERLGAELVEVNALTDKDLPALDGLYIGGGYPEMHGAALAANRSFRVALREAIEEGLPVLAECGGLIYLGEAVRVDGVDHSMTGVFPVTFELGKRPQGHGYTSVEVDGPNPFFAPGSVLLGHEFRYSFVRSARADALRMAFRMRRGHGFDGERDGLVHGNTLATFCHFHALGCREWATGFVREARRHHARLTGTTAGRVVPSQGSCRRERNMGNHEIERCGTVQPGGG